MKTINATVPGHPFIQVSEELMRGIHNEYEKYETLVGDPTKAELIQGSFGFECLTLSNKPVYSRPLSPKTAALPRTRIERLEKESHAVSYALLRQQCKTLGFDYAELSPEDFRPSSSSSFDQLMRTLYENYSADLEVHLYRHEQSLRQSKLADASGQVNAQPSNTASGEQQSSLRNGVASLESPAWLLPKKLTQLTECHVHGSYVADVNRLMSTGPAGQSRVATPVAAPLGWSERSEYLSEHLLGIMRAEPKYVAPVCARLVGRQLTGHLRDFIYRRVILSKTLELDSPAYRTEAEIMAKLAIWLSEFRKTVLARQQTLGTASWDESPIRSLLLQSTVKHYQTVPAMIVLGADVLVAECIRALNVLHLFDGLYSAALCLYLFPLQLAFYRRAQQAEHAFELAYMLRQFCTHVLPSQDLLKQLADATVQCLERLDEELLLHLLRHQIVVKDLVFNWMMECYVTCLDTQAVLYVWDQLMLTYWDDEVFVAMNLSLIWLLRDRAFENASALFDTVSLFTVDIVRAFDLCRKALQHLATAFDIDAELPRNVSLLNRKVHKPIFLGRDRPQSIPPRPLRYKLQQFCLSDAYVRFQVDATSLFHHERWMERFNARTAARFRLAASLYYGTLKLRATTSPVEPESIAVLHRVIGDRMVVLHFNGLRIQFDNVLLNSDMFQQQRDIGAFPYVILVLTYQHERDAMTASNNAKQPAVEPNKPSTDAAKATSTGNETTKSKDPVASTSRADNPNPKLPDNLGTTQATDVNSEPPITVGWARVRCFDAHNGLASRGTPGRAASAASPLGRLRPWHSVLELSRPYKWALKQYARPAAPKRFAVRSPDADSLHFEVVDRLRTPEFSAWPRPISRSLPDLTRRQSATTHQHEQLNESPLQPLVVGAATIRAARPPAGDKRSPRQPKPDDAASPLPGNKPVESASTSQPIASEATASNAATKPDAEPAARPAPKLSVLMRLKNFFRKEKKRYDEQADKAAGPEDCEEWALAARAFDVQLHPGPMERDEMVFCSFVNTEADLRRVIGWQRHAVDRYMAPIGVDSRLWCLVETIAEGAAANAAVKQRSRAPWQYRASEIEGQIPLRRRTLLPLVPRTPQLVQTPPPQAVPPSPSAQRAYLADAPQPPKPADQTSQAIPTPNDTCHVYVDQLRFVPDNATIIKITGRVLNCGAEPIAADLKALPELQSHARSPKFHCRYTVPSLPADQSELERKNLLIFLRAHTVDVVTKELIVIGGCLLSLFRADGQLNQGGFELPLRQGLPSMQDNGVYPAGALQVFGAVPVTSLLVRIAAGLTDTFVHAPIYSAESYQKYDSWSLNESEKRIQQSFEADTLYPRSVKQMAVHLRKLENLPQLDDTEQLMQAVNDRLDRRRNFIPGHVPGNIDLLRAVRYRSPIGFYVTIDQAFGLSEGHWYQCIGRLMIEDANNRLRRVGAAKYDVITQNLNYDSLQHAPQWTDEPQLLRPWYNERAVLQIQVHRLPLWYVPASGDQLGLIEEPPNATLRRLDSFNTLVAHGLIRLFSRDCVLTGQHHIALKPADTKVAATELDNTKPSLSVKIWDAHYALSELPALPARNSIREAGVGTEERFMAAVRRQQGRTMRQLVLEHLRSRKVKARAAAKQVAPCHEVMTNWFFSLAAVTDEEQPI